MVQRRFPECGHWSGAWDLHDWCLSCRSSGKSLHCCTPSDVCNVCRLWHVSWFEYVSPRTYQDKNRVRDRREAERAEALRHHTGVSSLDDVLGGKLDFFTSKVSKRSKSHSSSTSSRSDDRHGTDEGRKADHSASRHQTPPARSSGSRGGVKNHDDAHDLVPDTGHEKSRRKNSSEKKDSDKKKCRDSESERRIASDRTSDTRSDRSGSGLGTELYSTSSQPKGRSLATKAELVFGCRAPEGVYRTTDKITGLSANGEKSRPVPDTGHGSVPDTGHKDSPFAIPKYKPDVKLVYATGLGSVPDTGHWAVPDTGHSTTSGTGHPKGPDSGVGPDIRYVKVVSVVKKTKRGDAASFIEPPSIPLKYIPVKVTLNK